MNRAGKITFATVATSSLLALDTKTSYKKGYLDFLNQSEHEAGKIF
jgi:hypothetical protein